MSRTHKQNVKISTNDLTKLETSRTLKSDVRCTPLVSLYHVIIPRF